MQWRQYESPPTFYRRHTVNKIALLFAALIVMSSSMAGADPSGCQMTGAVCSCWSATGGWTAVCYYPNCGPCALPPPPTPCVPDGSCTGPTPACGATGPGTDNCGDACSINGPVCPPPPPACVPNGTCTGAVPACGTAGPGMDNCGNVCTIIGPACPPSVGPCPAGTICGNVSASEDGTLLADISILLRNPAGQIVQSTRTDNQGDYSFAVADDATYNVHPGIGRRQVSTPSFLPLARTFAGNFQVRGVPAHVRMAGLAPGTFVLFSTASYAAPNAPSTYPGMPDQYWSASANADGTLATDLPGGHVYYATCWIPNNSKWVKSSSTIVSHLALVPETFATAACVGD